MPLTQPKRDKPLMRRYFREIGLPGKRLAQRCGVSHSQIYMARNRSVGADNAEKISRRMALILGLSDEERLELKAEIMGHPGNLVRAYLGSGAEAAKKFGVHVNAGKEIVHLEKTVAHAPGTRAVRRLEEMGAPEAVIEALRKRVRPAPSPPGRVTNTQRGLEARNKRAESLFLFNLFKPKTAEVMRRSSLSKKELYERAGIGKETLRKALYRSCKKATAQRIVRVLDEELGLTEEEREALQEELMTPPQKNF